MTSYMWIAIAVLMIALGGLGKLYHTEIGSHATTKAEKEVILKELNESNTRMLNYQNKVKALESEAVAFLAAQKELSINYSARVRELEGLKDRLETVKAKNTLVTRIVNKAYMKKQYELACASGDTTACELLKP